MMLSYSYTDEENTNEKAINETELETDLKSLQVEETNKKIEPSTTDDGVTVKKKSSTCNLISEELVKKTDQLEPVRKVDFPMINIPNFRDHFLPTYATRPRDDQSNWKDSRSNYPKEKKGHTSVSQSLSWRDPNFKYERCQQKNTSAFASRAWRNEDIRESRSRSFEEKSAIPKFPGNRERSKRGNWALTCAPDIILDNGLTEVEYVRKCVNELYEQHGELFATRPSEFEAARGEIKIICFTSNYEDKIHVAKVADILSEKIEHYPYCFFYFHNRNPVYMRTCENEIYELKENNNWKLIDFDE